MGRSIPVTHTIEVHDAKGFYTACWPRGAGRPSNAALTRYVAFIEAAGEPLVWHARVLNQRQRTCVAAYRGPAFAVVA